MGNEATRALEHYLRNESNTIHFLGADAGVNLLCEVLQDGRSIPGDAPDLVVIKENSAVIIEHFEFDSFRVTRKGSTSRTEQARIEREQSLMPATPDGVVYHGKIQATSSYSDYIANVSRSFKEHYGRIATYKKNLIECGTITEEMTIKTVFLIDDVSPIGSIAVDYSTQPSQIVPVILAQSPEFLQLLSDSCDLDYVLCCSSAGSNEYFWFIDLDQLPAYVEKQCDYASMQFLSSHPSVVIGKISIPHGSVGDKELPK